MFGERRTVMEESGMKCNCNYLCSKEHEIEEVRKSIPIDDKLFELADFFKVFGDSTRIRILYVLMNSTMCVCDIGYLLGMSQSAISHQLRLLKQMNLVKTKREGKIIFYTIADDHIMKILSQGMEHILGE